MIKNNKGFTMVELLAVLVILITIMLIAIPSITSSVERNKQKMLEKKYDIIESAAEAYINLYKNKLGSNYTKFINGQCGINVTNLVEVGLLTTEDLTDADDNQITGIVKYDDDDNGHKVYVFVDEGESC